MQDEEHQNDLTPDIEDDAIIGTAFKGSLAVFAGILLLGVCIWGWQQRAPEKAPEQVTEISVPNVPDRQPVTVPSLVFEDITREAHIDFLHVNGAYGDKLLPETMGGGVAFLDYNQDGAQDLFFVNSSYWPDHMPEGHPQATHALYANDGQGHFTNVTKEAGLDLVDYGMGVAVGDYNNDGWPDLFLTTVYQNRLLQNQQDGTFNDVTQATGLAGRSTAWSTCAAWFDLENDGDLDLYVGNYVRWSPEIDFEQGATLTGIGRAYGQPMSFQGDNPFMYLNNGDGSFTDISESSGVQVKNTATGVAVAKSLGVAPVDLDFDGWMDLVVANDTVQNFVFHNQKDGTFKEMGSMSGIAFDSYGKARGAMGIDTARFRDDDAIGVGIANFANEMTALYVGSPADLIFTDEAIPVGIGPASRRALKFGLFFFDYDLDGWQDMLTANGHLEEEIQQIQESQHYQQSAHLFWNAGPSQGCRFQEVSAEKAGKALFHPIVGRGSAFGDIDGDGDLDVVMTQVNGAPLLLRNDHQMNHRWLRLKLVGTSSNRDAIGAWVHARLGGQDLWRQVMPTRSYLSQSELPITLGLGASGDIELLEIIWPGGQVQALGPLPLNTLHVLKQQP
jgi:enediyne biosynthesis protein E4